MNANLLAIETSTRQPSVALAIPTTTVGRSAPSEQTTAQWLFPAIADLLAEEKLTPTELDLIAVTTGPGSFTGLRIGVTTAKALAYATSARVVAVHTLAVIAAQSGIKNATVVAVLDAQRRELFVAEVSLDSVGLPRDIGPTEIVPRESWVATLPADAIVTGPGLARLTIPTHVRALPPDTWIPTAESLTRLAEAKFEQGAFADLWTLTPQYIRRSYAEE